MDLVISPNAQYQPWLLFEGFNRELDEILATAVALGRKHPEIYSRIEKDMDTVSLLAKKERLADARWEKEHNQAILLESEESISPFHEPELMQTGRARVNPKLIYLFIVLRGRFDGLFNMENWNRISDSVTVWKYVGAYCSKLPHPQTLSDHLNSLSCETHTFIQDCLLAHALELDLDDFSTLTMDSTHIHSHSAWPTDSGLICKMLHSAYRMGQRLHNVSIQDFRIFKCPVWLKDLDKLDFLINQTKDKTPKAFRKNYDVFIKTAQKLINRLDNELDLAEEASEALDLPPSRRRSLNTALNKITSYLVDAFILCTVAYCRVVEKHDFEREDFEKIFSVSDTSAAFIRKGGRETVFGYRVQVNRSQNGFITGIMVPEGNVPDSKMLVPMTKAHIDNTGVVPEAVSTDDGYASAEGRAGVIGLGVARVSINGSKGKRLTPSEEWESNEYVELRRTRSAVESLMFTLKFKFRFGRFSRCGHDAVQSEAMETVIAHNFWRIGHEIAKRRKTENAFAATG